MTPFRYASPRSLDDALALLGEYGPDARVLAGGTDLLVRLRLGHMRPSLVIDIKRVDALRADVVEVTHQPGSTESGERRADRDSCLRVGARTVMTDLIADARIRNHYPALVEAASVVGSVQIRNRATLAGNICNASPAADTAPALLVYRASVNLVNANGRRRVPLAEFFTGPGRTVLDRGELVESIDLPLPVEPAGAAFGRVTRRRGVDLATINLCCLVTRSGETRFAYGAVAARPFVVTDDSGTLATLDSTAAARDAALDRLIAQATPISDVRADRDYRLAMLGVMSRRALQAAQGRLRAL
jgi:CO/xanthine dehydrogenase FAD-binding subunit